MIKITKNQNGTYEVEAAVYTIKTTPKAKTDKDFIKIIINKNGYTELLEFEGNEENLPTSIDKFYEALSRVDEHLGLPPFYTLYRTRHDKEEKNKKSDGQFMPSGVWKKIRIYN